MYLNFGLILCTMGRWDSCHHRESELLSSSCSKQRAEGIFRFIKPVLKCAWEVPIRPQSDFPLPKGGIKFLGSSD